MKHNLFLVSIITVSVHLYGGYAYTVEISEFDPFNAGSYCDLSYEIKADPKEDEHDECYHIWAECTADSQKWSKNVCGSPCKRKYYECKKKDQGTAKAAAMDVMQFWKD